MLGKRISASRRVISLYDPAIFNFSADVRARYASTRDINVLGDLSISPEKPTIFTLDPLRPEHAHLLDDPSYYSRRMIFSLYVSRVDNSAVATVWETTNGVRSMTAESAEAYGMDVIEEMANVIGGFARSDTSPFLPPDGYGAFERSYLIRRALAVPEVLHATTNSNSPDSPSPDAK